MGIASDISKPLGLIKVILNVPRSFNRLLSASIIVLFSQLIGAEFTHADELIKSEASIADQKEVRKKQTSKASSTSITTREPLSTNVRNEVRCLALNIYFEARSEPETGQRAVGHVVMNRVAHSRYPDSVCQVVQQGGEKKLHRCQFSWWCDGLSDKPVNKEAWDQSLRLAQEIYLGVLEDTTDGALWYHAIYVKPYWSNILLQGDKIGQHIFYLENRQSGKTM